MLRWHESVYSLLAEVVRHCGAEIHEATTKREPRIIDELRCVRDEAEIIVEVFRDEGGSPVGLWGRRQLARRKQFHADVALIHDLCGDTQKGRSRRCVTNRRVRKNGREKRSARICTQKYRKSDIFPFLL